MPSKQPLTDKELAAWEDSRDLAAELEQSVREMCAGTWARKTEFLPQPDGSVRQLVTLADGNIEHDSIIPEERWHATRARSQTGLSQAEFARRIGVSKRTVQEWEQGRKHPSGAARVLLKLIVKHPEMILDMVA